MWVRIRNWEKEETEEIGEILPKGFCMRSHMGYAVFEVFMHHCGYWVEEPGDKLRY